MLGALHGGQLHHLVRRRIEREPERLREQLAERECERQPECEPEQQSQQQPDCEPEPDLHRRVRAQCSATVSTVSTWTGGYQISINVANTGTLATTSWHTVLTLPGTDAVASSWNAVTTASGQSITAANESYNGQLAPGSATSWGMTVNGNGPPPTSATCSSS